MHLHKRPEDLLELARRHANARVLYLKPEVVCRQLFKLAQSTIGVVSSYLHDKNRKSSVAVRMMMVRKQKTQTEKEYLNDDGTGWRELYCIAHQVVQNADQALFVPFHLRRQIGRKIHIDLQVRPFRLWQVEANHGINRVTDVEIDIVVKGCSLQARVIHVGKA